MSEFSSDYILEQYRKINENDFGSESPEDTTDDSDYYEPEPTEHNTPFPDCLDYIKPQKQ